MCRNASHDRFNNSHCQGKCPILTTGHVSYIVWFTIMPPAAARRLNIYTAPAVEYEAGKRQMDKVKIGFVPAHREPFDDDWAVQMRKRCLGALARIKGLEVVVPDGKLTPGGLVRDDADADKVIRLFRDEKIDGLIIGTMTFGDEVSALAVASAFRDLPSCSSARKKGISRRRRAQVGLVLRHAGGLIRAAPQEDTFPLLRHPVSPRRNYSWTSLILWPSAPSSGVS